MSMISRQKLIEELERIKAVYRSAECFEDEDCMSKGCAECALDRVKEFIESQPPADQWIPCSERLPDELAPVNITWVNRRPPIYYKEIKDIPFSGTGIFYRGKWYWYSVRCEDVLAEYGENEADEMNEDIEITAWKPLDEPYKGVE